MQASHEQKKIELAVIIPVYNEQEIITEVINSWEQKLAHLGIHYEIHVYNDGSKDQTLQILREYAKTKERVVVHDKPNSGHGSSSRRATRRLRFASSLRLMPFTRKPPCQGTRDCFHYP